MSGDLPPIPAPLPGDVRPGRRYSLCTEALSPVLDALVERAKAVGWTEGEVAAALIGVGGDRMVSSEGPEAAGEALMLAMDLARHSEPKVR